MKLRPFLILLLFVVSAGILVWIYHTARHAPKEQKTSPWAETMSDLDDCCRRKHVKSVQYEHFADIADDESRRNAALLFRAMALSERLQEHNCAEAIMRLGGSYLPPVRVVVFRSTTEDNLRRSIDYERESLGNRHGEEIDRAMNKGNRYAARALTWAAAGDLKHQVLMEHSLYTFTHPGVAVASYRVCPTCGNIYTDKHCAPYCPFCLTAGREFVVFE